MDTRSMPRVLSVSNMPSISIVKSNNEQVVFDLINSDTSMANALLRTMKLDVPTMAIDFVEVEDNTSSISNESLIHRLAQIPLISTDAEQFETSSNCTCADYLCRKCAVIYELNVKCDEETRQMNVTSNDLVVITKGTTVVPRNYNPNADRNTEMHSDHPPILICKLRANEQISLTAAAIKGTGKMHSKWEPGVALNYKPETLIYIHLNVLNSLNETKKNRIVDEIVKSCPMNIFTKRENTIDIEDSYRCTHCGSCTEKVKKIGVPGLVDVGYRETTFRVYVETNGSLTPQALVISAFRVLKNRIRIQIGDVKNLMKNMS